MLGKRERPPPRQPAFRRRRHLALVAINALLWLTLFCGPLFAARGRAFPMVLPAMFGIYLLAALLSSVPRYLAGLNSAENAAQYVARLREAAPAIAVGWRCWREEMRPQLVTEPGWETAFGPDGKIQRVSRMRTRTEMRPATVMLGSGSEPFPVTQWQDRSPELAPAAFASPIMSIDFAVTVETDPAVDAALAAFKDQVRSRHIQPVSQFTMWESRTIDGFRPRMLAVVEPAARPALLRVGAYLLATVLGLAGIYALWFDRVAGSGSYTFVKRVAA